MSQTWVVLGAGALLAALFAWAGVELRFRQRYGWVAGYNTASPEERKKYDIEGLSHHLGNGLITLGVLLAAAALSLVSGFFTWFTVSIIAFLLVAALIVVGGQKFTPAARFPAPGESGHTLHRVLRLLLPRKAYRALEAGTRQWEYECRCGHTKDFWEAGGIRYKAVGEPRMLLRCDACGRTTLQKVRRKRTDRRPAPPG